MGRQDVKHERDSSGEGNERDRDSERDSSGETAVSGNSQR